LSLMTVLSEKIDFTFNISLFHLFKWYTNVHWFEERREKKLLEDEEKKKKYIIVMISWFDWYLVSNIEEIAGNWCWSIGSNIKTPAFSMCLSWYAVGIV